MDFSVVFSSSFFLVLWKYLSINPSVVRPQTPSGLISLTSVKWSCTVCSFAMHHAFTTAANTLTDMQLAQQVTPKWSALYIESFQNRSAKFPPELGNSLTCPLWEINLFINFPWCMQNTCKISWTQSCHRWTICGDRNPGRLGGWVGPSRG